MGKEHLAIHAVVAAVRTSGANTQQRVRRQTTNTDMIVHVPPFNVCDVEVVHKLQFVCRLKLDVLAHFDLSENTSR